MKKIILRYGIYSTIFIIFLMSVFFFLVRNLDYDKQQVAGYLSMLVSMIFVFFGIRHYRNEKNDGFLTFGQGLKVGVLIVLFPAVCFGLFDVLYTSVLNPHWMTDYTNYYLTHFKQSLPVAQFEVKKRQLEDSMKLFSNPVAQFFIMFLTVFVIGFIVTIISALALRRKPTVAIA
jgi:hypothetical protein